MPVLSIILSILGLSLFEIISSTDNAIINAEVLSTMKPRARRWFLFWGIIWGVFIVRGLLPLIIVWLVLPHLTIFQAATATFSSDPAIAYAIEKASPILLCGGGVFMVFVFFHWLFLEQKNFGLWGEKFIFSQGVWFYAIVSLILSIIIWYGINTNPLLAFSATIGSTVFFITHGFKQQAELAEKDLMKRGMSDLSKILYLEVIDATFSIDGVLGAFAFTFSVPLILLGNGLGAIILRQMTVSNVDRIKKLIYIKNGAMYSILFLGTIMIMDSFGARIPYWLSPIITFTSVGYFFFRSRKVQA